MRNRLRGLVAFAVLLAMPAAAENYQIDPLHTDVGFSVSHMVVSHVRGGFDKFKGSFVYDPKGDPKDWSASAEIDAASIDTKVGPRDEHLRSNAFLDAGKCPKITFVGKGVTDYKDGMGKLKGDLTIRCTTKPVVLDVEFGGVQKDPQGKTHAGFTAKTTIDRNDFGVSWNKTLETGGLLVGDKVDIQIDVEGVVEAPLPADTESAKK
jgi:polyisoprenoid-binding protein YceI